MRSTSVILICASICVLTGSNGAEVDFVNDIQPIFAEKCTLCHGPDDKKGGLQLTGIEPASILLKSGSRAIVPGDVLASHLIERIHSSDPDEVMPPPDKAEPLTGVEKSKLEQWIKEGADWPKHWAYQDLAKFDEKVLSEGQSPIDFLVSKTLEKKGIEASLPTDDITLIRRLFYDLMGIAPYPEQVAENLPRFQADRESAVDRLVNDLLASPHFGERWGRHWLDHARYADSDGYEKDNNRMNAWRYRDWVIESINADMPFDQFTIEQFGGDLLPERSEDQLLATAFNRQTLTNTEGGTDKEQWRVAAVMDRVETMGSVWLGLSVGCARCHTHKYDEITHDEYYQLFAYFNNGDETTSKITHTEEAVEKWKSDLAKHEKDVAEVKAQLAKAKSQLVPQVPAMIAKTNALIERAVEQKAFAPLGLAKFSGPKGVKFTQDKKDFSVLVAGKSVDDGTYTIEGTIPEGMVVTGIKLEVMPDESLPSQGPGKSPEGNFVLNQIQLSVNGERYYFGDAEASFTQGGNWQPHGAIDLNVKARSNGTGWAVGPQAGKSHEVIFGLVKPLTKSEEAQAFKIQLVQNYGAKHMIGKFRISALTSPTKLAVPTELRETLTTQEGKVDGLTLLDQFYSKWHPELRGLGERLNTLESSVPEKPGMDVRVITERQKERRETHVFRRGEFKEPLNEVTAGTFASLPPIEHRGESGDRLDLGKWLVSGENPLPPRVVVNRIWGHLFGEGLVPTVNDFGVRGDRPSHPELLDWLASEFIRNGWSRKELIKTIVASEAYQRSSAHRPDLVEMDPKNRFLARQNRFRVEAEIVRDISLSAAGLLSQKVGGPSVFPLIPPGVTDANYNSAFKWVVSPGEDRYRRGLYTFFKRTAPHPNLMTFDCPDSNVTNVMRGRSNTPLAALITLNNDTFAEAAQALAGRVLREISDGDDLRLKRAFQLCLSRAPSKEEQGRLASLLEDARSYYRSAPEDAEKFAGEHVPEGIAPEEAASWAAMVRVILNLDEFITRS
ncbi:PSD1 and planctomycete cytochrome C domain-containing protein [Verrucomicrobiales bacterium]|nr:PSD1 and planctomycete cytochrome C domain-containing protein [Verrucomicrobiales bacterium]